MSDSQPLSEKELKLLLKNLDTKKGLKAMIYLVIGTGMSPKDCLSITLDKIDYTKNVVMVYDNELNRYRSVKLNASVQKALMQYQDGRYKPTERLFDIVPQTAINKLSDLSKERLNRYITWSSLRHTWAVLSFKEGIGLLDMLESSGATAEQLAEWRSYTKENGGKKDPPDILANIIRLL